MSRVHVQFLTAVFALRPSRRKSAALERARAAAEDVYWAQLDHQRAVAEALADASDRTASRAVLAQIASAAARGAARSGLPDSIGAGIGRDVEQTIASYVALKQEGRAAGWPARARGARCPDRAAVLDELAHATTAARIVAARRALEALDHGERPRPLTLARARDCRIVRDGAGRLAVVLNVLRARDARARPADIHDGVDATTGEAIRGSRRKTVLVVPLACSRWHENNFLSGGTQLRSAVVLRRGERWFLCAQFALAVPRVELSGASLGMSRGCAGPVATAVVGSTGAVLHATQEQRHQTGARIAAVNDRQRRRRRRRARGLARESRAIDHHLHCLANDTVAKARAHKAAVTVERIDRPMPAHLAGRSGSNETSGSRHVLTKAQFGRLAKMLSYKLTLAGLPPWREVLAGGSSPICPACAMRAPGSRVAGGVFRCVACGQEIDGDSNAAVLTARRGVLIRTIRKGDKLDALHRNMVAGLGARDDGGLGPLAVSRRVVAAHAAAATAAEPAWPSAMRGLAVVAAQEAPRAAENAPAGVLAERSGRTSQISPSLTSENGLRPAKPHRRRRSKDREVPQHDAHVASSPQGAGELGRVG